MFKIVDGVKEGMFLGKKVCVCEQNKLIVSERERNIYEGEINENILSDYNAFNRKKRCWNTVCVCVWR